LDNVSKIAMCFSTRFGGVAAGIDALLRIHVQVRSNFILEFLLLTCPSQKHR
jgi:hypothetical protein